MGGTEYSPFQSFVPHFNALSRVGYYKLIRDASERHRFIFKIYRTVAFSFILLYNLQHIIKVIQARHSTDQMVDTLFVLLTTLNTLGKQVAFNLRSRRIDQLCDIVRGPLFCLTQPYHVKVMKKNETSMARLLKLYHCAIFICGTMWTVHPLVNRAMGVHVEFTAYFPFDTENAPFFQLALAYMSIMITFQAYGNVTMDCTIVSLYSQGTTQLLILRRDLENLANFENISSNGRDAYKDFDAKYKGTLQKRFVGCVERYRAIVWFIKEVESIFDEAMVVQFFIMAWVLCMTVYKIVGLQLISAEFVSMAVYLGCMLAQLFIYCYYGTNVKYESAAPEKNYLESIYPMTTKFSSTKPAKLVALCMNLLWFFESERINESLYCGNWLNLSPGFRKQLLVFMTRCCRPITPRAAFIIPLSLETYIAVLKMSYTLFTFLDKK